MAVYGHAIKNAFITTDTTVSTAINISGFNKVGIEVPTAEIGLYTATCNIYIQVAQNSDDTFRRVKEQGVYSAGSGIFDFEVPSNIGNFIMEVPANGWSYMKIESRTSADSTVLKCKVHLSNLHYQ